MKLRLVLFIVILALAGITAIRLRATAQETLPTPCVIVVPSDWGEFRGISRYGLAFEDRNGTLRLIEQIPCSLDHGHSGVPRVSVEVRRK